MTISAAQLARHEVGMYHYRLKWFVVIACSILIAGCAGGGLGGLVDDPANDPDFTYRPGAC